MLQGSHAADGCLGGVRWGAQVRALRMLTGLGALLLARFGTTAQADAELAAAATADDVALALRFRMEKKRLLASFLQDVAGRMKVPSPSPHDPPCRSLFL